jgi:hypothetical protein
MEERVRGEEVLGEQGAELRIRIFLQSIRNIELPQIPPPTVDRGLI